MGLNEEQTIFFNEVCHAITVESTGCIGLDAAGGTGKTYTLLSLLEWVRSEGFIATTLSPTHKAAENFNKHGANCKTIAAFFGARIEIDDEGVEHWKYYAPEMFIAPAVVVVDESSMINSKIYDLFLKHVAPHTLIVFAGDRKQLPPVDDESFCVFDHLLITYTFTQNMRSPDSASNIFVQNFRDAVDSHSLPIIPRGFARTEEYVINDFIKRDDAVILAGTNKRVRYFNYMIRLKLFGAGKDLTYGLDDYYAGETLIFKSGSCSRGLQFSGKPTFSYTNGAKLTLRDVGTYSERMMFKMCDHQEATDQGIKKCAKCDLAGHRVTGLVIRFWQLTDTNGCVWYRPETPDDKASFYKICASYRKYIFSLKPKSRKREWIALRNLKLEFNSSLEYKYSSTVHSAQGSEYDHVYVDMPSFRPFNKDLVYYKMTYCAVSRMRETVVFMN